MHARSRRPFELKGIPAKGRAPCSGGAVNHPSRMVRPGRRGEPEFIDRRAGSDVCPRVARASGAVERAAAAPGRWRKNQTTPPREVARAARRPRSARATAFLEARRREALVGRLAARRGRREARASLLLRRLGVRATSERSSPPPRSSEQRPTGFAGPRDSATRPNARTYRRERRGRAAAEPSAVIAAAAQRPGRARRRRTAFEVRRRTRRNPLSARRSRGLCCRCAAAPSAPSVVRSPTMLEDAY